jgi:hypothetical protein
MGIFRSNDPTTFDDVDGIIIDESAPTPNIRGASSNIAILVGQFQRGPTLLTEVGSIGQLQELYGKSSFSGNQALKRKRFGRLRIIRAQASDAVVATDTLNASATPTLKFDALWAGVYGNGIKITVAAGSDSGKKYTIQDTNANAVLSTEIYDNIEIANVTPATFAASQLIFATVLDTAGEPDDQAATALAAGAEGTIADTDYQTALIEAAQERAGNFVFLDEYNATRNGYLKTHAADTQDKMVICAGPEVQDVAAALSDAALNKDADGRIVYAYPWLEATIDGASTFTSPASWYASVMSQTAPSVDPAFTSNTQFLSGVTALKKTLTRADYINLKDGGVSAFELDRDIGFKIKSGVVTQTANSSKTQVLRRRMADWITDSISVFLKSFQNAPNTKENRDAVNGAILDWVNQQESLGILPSDSEVQDGFAKLVDTESLNTNLSIGQGFFRILYKQRIFSAMRFIVLQAEIGQTVVVTEEE